MQMVFENDKTKKVHPALTLEETPGIKNNLNERGVSENWEPGYDRAGKEIRVFGFKNAVARPRQGWLLARPRLAAGRSQAEPGNQSKMKDEPVYSTNSSFHADRAIFG